jgi:hypothetical protein
MLAKLATRQKHHCKKYKKANHSKILIKALKITSLDSELAKASKKLLKNKGNSAFKIEALITELITKTKDTLCLKQ